MADLYLDIKQLHSYCSIMLKNVVTVCEKENIPYYVIYGTLLGTIRHKGPIPWDPDVDIYVPENELERFINTIEKELGEEYWVDYRKKGDIPKPFPRIGLKGYDTETLHIDVFRMSGLPDSKLQQKLLTKRGRTLWILWKAKVINPKEYYSNKKQQIGALIFKIIAAPLSLNYILKTIDKLCNKIEVFSTKHVGRVMGQGAIYDKSFFEEYELHEFVDFKVRTPQNADKLLTIMYGDYMKYPSEDYQSKMINREFLIKAKQ